MLKKIVGITVIIVLAGIVLFNYVQQRNEVSKEDNEYNVSGDTDAEGGAISSIEKDKVLQPGDTAPDFQLETLSGDTLKLSDLRGKKVILNFWATWCPPCRKEMPAMQDFYNEHKENVEVVAVNLTDSEKKEKDVHKYINKYDYTYPIPLDRKSKARNMYQVFSVPTTYFIDTKGKIHQVKPGPMTYEFMKDTINSAN